MANGMVIKADPQKLEAKASEVERAVTHMREAMRRIDAIVQKSPSYWEGEGNTAYLRAYRKHTGEIDRALRRFTENVTNLRQIAGIYKGTNTQAAALAKTLPQSPIA